MPIQSLSVSETFERREAASWRIRAGRPPPTTMMNLVPFFKNLLRNLLKFSKNFSGWIYSLYAFDNIFNLILLILIFFFKVLKLKTFVDEFDEKSNKQSTDKSNKLSKSGTNSKNINNIASQTHKVVPL